MSPFVLVKTDRSLGLVCCGDLLFVQDAQLLVLKV
ncbi:hypothetical protein V144x_36370 [Gimesia aquarii]|uniref:Uncharacterized protein n=1 Tax=Gimesia aquarii TaxID=2527964 RepID=A0A517VYT4_9PLAN|nr:hypothetical protein V144x_36370 [Gimesia aquarii]